MQHIWPPAAADMLAASNLRLGRSLPHSCCRLTSRRDVSVYLSLPPASGDVARKYIRDPELLSFIDLECFIWSTVSADLTPMINAGMVFCDRHFGGINYPVGGVGQIAEEMADGEGGAGVCFGRAG